MHQPAKIDDIATIVRDAGASGRKLEIVGGGTREGVGTPDREADRISTALLSGIVSYDPAELVLTAWAGTPLFELEAALAERGQAFMFEPHGAPGSTIGGVIAASASGSRRVSAGAVRDHLLGFHAVSGRGEAFKAGGKVVKNVTGYDLAKLMCGSWGRLAVLAEVTLKVLPSALERRTLIWSGLDVEAAWHLMGEAMRLPADVAAGAFLPEEGRTLVRIEGVGPSVAARARLLSGALSRYGTPEELGSDAAVAAWAPLAGAAALQGFSSLWRISVPRKQGVAVARSLTGAGGQWMADWAGGLLFYGEDAPGPPIRDIASEAGGHATLLRAPDAFRAQVPAFQPQARGMAALNARVRRSFDPAGVFATGRFLDDDHAD